MILYNVAQARTNTLAHNEKLREIMDVINRAVVKSVEEGKFKTDKLSFSTEVLKGNNERFIKGYFESLGYDCSIEIFRDRKVIFFEVSWY